MEILYHIGFSKMCDQAKVKFCVKSLGMMEVIFGVKEDKRYAVIAEYKRRGPSRSGGRWHGNPGVYEVYCRVNFPNREAGNAAYLRVKELFRGCRPWYEGSNSYDCYNTVSVENIIDALSKPKRP